MKKNLWSLLLMALVVVGCSNDDNGIEPPVTPDPDPNVNLDVQDFMWKAMNTWYFWVDAVEDLNAGKYPTDAKYTEYLASKTDPEAFFYEDLLHEEDRFSYLAEDYKTLVESFQGVSKSNGLEFGLSYYGDGNDVLGYVRYIVPNSNAASADIKRGDIFISVDGQTLTDANYSSLLFGPNDTYELGLADIVDNTVTPNGKTVSLTKEEGLSENPIFLDKTLEIGGQKVGYLVFNGFISNYDEELNEVFGEFKANGVTDLVLDMRYNPGGSVNTSRLLASMIYGTNTQEVYIRQRWNDFIQSELGDDYVTDYFADKTGEGSAINSLELPKVYVIATGSSASASELVMNGLAPYIDVVHVGSTTRGKNEFSITLVDAPNNSYIYSPAIVSQINSDNSWGLQPLVGRNENAAGFYDYTAGLNPDIELREDIGDMGVLGDINEPLLARALQEITGSTAKRQFTAPALPEQLLTSSKFHKGTQDNMYLDKPLKLELER